MVAVVLLGKIGVVVVECNVSEVVVDGNVIEDAAEG